MVVRSEASIQAASVAGRSAAGRPREFRIEDCCCAMGRIEKSYGSSINSSRVRDTRTVQLKTVLLQLAIETCSGGI
jgi:hypothetical protein